LSFCFWCKFLLSWSSNVGGLGRVRIDPLPLLIPILLRLQEITADSAIEIPDVCVSKQLMRRHVHNLLNILSPKEKSIIRLRFGIEDGKEKTLQDIGKVFGLTKERVRQLESRALSKLKECLESQGLDAYSDLLI